MPRGLRRERGGPRAVPPASARGPGLGRTRPPRHRDTARIADGTPFAEVATRDAAHPRVVGVGLNCTAPDHVAPLLASLDPRPPDVHLVVYPNIGDTWDARQGRWVPLRQQADVQQWRPLGAEAVGGCCGTTPEDIHQLAEDLA